MNAGKKSGWNLIFPAQKRPEGGHENTATVPVDNPEDIPKPSSATPNHPCASARGRLFGLSSNKHTCWRHIDEY